MAQLVALVVSEDDAFRHQIGRLLRSSAIPVSVIDERVARDTIATAPDVVVVDTRGDATSAMSTIERLRGSGPSLAIFAVALAADSALILESMRAGANEFFTWPPDAETFHGAMRRTAARRETAHGARPPATTLVFFGAKGGAGTTTLAVNCGVELARLSKKATVIVDLKPGLGEVALFLGVRPRFSVLDAIDNLHRLDREFLRELVAKHKSGLEILAGSDQFDRPGGADGGAIEELLRLLTRQYDYIVVDGGSQITACTVSALYTADQVFLVAKCSWWPTRMCRRCAMRSACSIGCASSARAGNACACCSTAPPNRFRSRPNRSRARSGIRFTTRSRATTRPSRRRSTPACRWR
jgi:Flp pilus assembly CpaE family ATPase